MGEGEGEGEGAVAVAVMVIVHARGTKNHNSWPPWPPWSALAAVDDQQQVQVDPASFVDQSK